MSTLRTVLYVEDDHDIQEVARLALEVVGGLEVVVASSGDEAIQRAQEAVPDLVLLDVMMPGMDGPTTMSALKRLDGMRDVPIIFVTAKVQSAEIEQYIALGAIGVIAKPFDPMTLADEARALWESAGR
jgi:two-component system, OmpR family, response regulator